MAMKLELKYFIYIPIFCKGLLSMQIIDLVWHIFSAMIKNKVRKKSKTSKYKIYHYEEHNMNPKYINMKITVKTQTKHHVL